MLERATPAPARSARITSQLVRQVCLRFPLYSGCATLANTEPFRKLSAQLPAVLEVRLRSGPRVFVRPDDFVGRSLFFFGDLDRKITWILSRILRPGDTVIDVGANVGAVALIAARLVGPGGSVHAFEPQPAIRSLLERSVRLNRFQQVTVHGVALGDAAGPGSLTVPEGNFGGASFVRVTPGGSAVSVPVVRGTEYLERLSLRPIRLVKIDVEGYEEVVVRGAREYFARHPPDAILFECNDPHLRFRDRGVVRALADIGYRFLDLPRALFVPRVKLIDATSSARGHDILAVRAGAAHDDIARALGAG